MASCFGCGDASVEQEDKLAVVRGLLLAGADPNTQDPGHETVRAPRPVPHSVDHYPLLHHPIYGGTWASELHLPARSL